MTFASAEPIASTTIDLIHSDGRRVPGRIWIGLPYQVDEVEAKCACGIEGLDEHLPDISGNDTLQALLLGGRIVLPSTDDDVELEPYFGGWVE